MLHNLGQLAGAVWVPLTCYAIAVALAFGALKGMHGKIVMLCSLVSMVSLLWATYSALVFALGVHDRHLEALDILVALVTMSFSLDCSWEKSRTREHLSVTARLRG